MKPTTFRGQPVDHAVHDRKADTYALIAPNGECIAELQAREFLSISNRTNLEVRSGRHRSTPSQDQRGANRKSGDPWGDFADIDPYVAIDFAAPNQIAGATTNARAGVAAGLSVRGIGAIQAAIYRNMFNAALCGDWKEHERTALRREGIIAGEIVGYRCWRIEQGMLRSVYQNDVWLPGKVLEGRELGDWDQRGIHAWKSSRSKEYNSYLRSYLSRANPYVWSAFLQDDIHSDTRPAMVTGTIFMWGDVVEHERGWRAEYARVRSLDWLYPDDAMMGREQFVLDELRAIYGVTAPCLPVSHRECGSSARAVVSDQPFLKDSLT